ncbi:MAG: ROK family protein [Armatimonadetes bacterium]|nr:ROK family protein [Armatimonadota bacterium]
MTACAIGLDVGGTRLSAGLVDTRGALLAHAQESTPPDGPAATNVLRRLTLELAERARRGGHDLLGVGVGFGGPVDYGDQSIVMSHHVGGWETGLKLAQQLAEGLGLPAMLDNDANCGGLAEALFGAGCGHRSVLYVNIGTGIGGALVLAGRVHHGAHSIAGELGHCVVKPDGPPCTCDKEGCLEALASGSALGREGRLAGLGQHITGREVAQLALEGDATAGRIVDEAAGWLGLALGNAANLWDPDVIVLGGGVAEMGERLLEPTRRSYQRTAMLSAKATPIVCASLGYAAGVIGAAALLFAPCDAAAGSA